MITTDTRLEHHLRSGNTYRVDRRLERRGDAILLDRSFTAHPEIGGVRSILLPRLHLWVMFFEAHRPPHPMSCYIHMASIADEGTTITVEDLYLDVILYQDGRWRLDDVGEFRAAVAAGELSPAQIEAALLGLEHACRLIETHGAGLEGYLHKTLPMPRTTRSCTDSG